MRLTSVPCTGHQFLKVRRTLTVFIFASLLLASCKKNIDTTPSWITIDQFNLTTDLGTQGEATEGISDAWVYMDNQPVGVFELPCKIPIVAEGTHSFSIYAGIKNNGISATRKRYPFYTKWEGDLTLIKGDTVAVTPNITYHTGLTFSMLEDFEDSGIDFIKQPISDTNMIFIEKASNPTIVEWGDRCGGIFLSGADSIYEGATALLMDLPKSAAEVYVEIDYMNTNGIALGVIAQNASDVAKHGPLVLMNAQNPGEQVWKKIYIDLKDDVSSELSATSFEIYLLSILDDGDEQGFVYVDNIKIVHF